MNPVTPVLDQLDSIIDNVEQSLNIDKKSEATNGTADEGEASKVEETKAAEGKKEGDELNNNDTNNAKKKKKEKKKKGPKPEAAPKLPVEQSQFLQCDLRVGQIKTITGHPEASGLYVLTVGYGADEERTVCAGLRNFIKEEDLLNKHFVTICNLKPRKLRGIESQAMILAGSVVSGEEKEKVVPLTPAENTQAGQIVACQSFSQLERTVEEGKNVSGKNWDKVVARLSVKDGHACYDGHPLIVNDQPVICDLPDGSEIH